MESRNELSISLSQPNQYATGHIEQEGMVYSSMPPKIEALILHRRKLIDSTLLLPNIASNFCVEVTLLHNGGVEHEQYTKQLFRIGCVGQFIQKLKNNIIISELKSTVTPGVHDFSNIAPAGYSNQAYLSQLSLSQMHLSQQTEGNLPSFGYGL